jgi:hypothetical protein
MFQLVKVLLHLLKWIVQLLMLLQQQMIILRMRQRIEGLNLQHLKKGTSNAESLTVSFWVKSTKTGTNILEFLDKDNTRHICQTYTINVSTLGKRKL